PAPLLFCTSHPPPSRAAEKQKEWSGGVPTYKQATPTGFRSRLVGLLLLVVALAAGCSTKPPVANRSAASTAGKIPSATQANHWTLHGEIIDTCNCEVICPCMVGAAPTEGKCLTDVTWCIDDGRYGSLDLSGLTVVLAILAPGPKFNDGQWRLAMYGDQRA